MLGSIQANLSIPKRTCMSMNHLANRHIFFFFDKLKAHADLADCMMYIMYIPSLVHGSDRREKKIGSKIRIV